jgi:hypothetical protein
MTPAVETSVGTSRRRRIHIATPEETLANFRQQHPTADAAELREIARQYILASTVFEDLAANNFTMWLVDKALARTIKDEPREIDPTKAAERAALKQQLIESMARADAERIEAEVTIRLLEYETPYGKQLGDCTGAECTRLSRRYGGFFAELGKRITRSEVVRAHLTETELQAIARTHRLIGEKAAR